MLPIETALTVSIVESFIFPGSNIHTIKLSKMLLSQRGIENTPGTTFSPCVHFSYRPLLFLSSICKYMKMRNRYKMQRFR